ncbi:unnamed protein product [Rotaria socialis]
MVLTTKFLCLLFIVVLVAAYNTVETAGDDAPNDSQDAESRLALQNQDDSIAEANLIHSPESTIIDSSLASIHHGMQRNDLSANELIFSS